MNLIDDKMAKLLEDLEIMCNNLEIMRDATEREETLFSFYAQTQEYLGVVQMLKRSVQQEMASRLLGG